MKKFISYLLVTILFYSCNNSKWETIRGKGINDEPKSIDNVIYFENEANGVVGGYTLISDSNAVNDVKLSQIPTLYLTTDAGKNWREIYFDTTIKQSVRNAYLHLDTLICELDSLVLFSLDKGYNFQTYPDSSQQVALINKYITDNKSEINDDKFSYNGKDYYIAELYRNNIASVIICRGQETITDYYFVSFDNGKSWDFLQKCFGDNRQRFLLQDKYLYCYDFPLGLQRLKLK
jgi:hypothetical protein